MERHMETDPSGFMERQLVEKYMRAQGHSLRSVRELPEALRRPLLAAAGRYASLQMIECETEHRSFNPFIDAGISKT
jgi:hypothetical protein